MMSRLSTSMFQTIVKKTFYVQHMHYYSSLPPRILTNYGGKTLNCKYSVKNHEHDYPILKYRKEHYLTQYRLFYAWLNNIFNQVDPARIKDVGPDRACAEWLLRCGAVVKWHGKEKEIKDYNSLPVGNYRTLKIESVDATDSAIMETGFTHFKDLEYLKKLKLKNCTYLTDESIPHLAFDTKDRLEWLELSDNGNVTEKGLRHLRKLRKLKFLKLANLPGVQNPSDLLELLKKDMPDCEIIYDDKS